MEMTYRGVVYPAQTDAMGHMTVQYYVAAFDQAFWHFVNSLGYNLDWRHERNEGWADVNYEINFRNELKVGDIYTVSSKIKKIGRSSLVTQHFLSDKDAQLCCEIVMTSVYFNLAERKAIEIPETVRSLAQEQLQFDANQ
ncbi:acyl-CoA thioesterase [Pseudomonas sp. NY15181]|uniref:acyl-CoA thioesterase n=1 Tax=Pseudomonas sp. NY15181 TaxID=3400349 RepID=UPI003A8C258B